MSILSGEPLKCIVCGKPAWTYCTYYDDELPEDEATLCRRPLCGAHHDAGMCPEHRGAPMEASPQTRHGDLLVARRLWERLHRPITTEEESRAWPEWQQEYERTIAALEPLTDDELRFIVRGRLWAVGT